MSYSSKDVLEGRRLVSEIGKHQFALGDLALKVAPMGETKANNGADKIVSDFADEIGLSSETLHEYRRVAAAWPQGARAPSASYTLHRELAPHPKRRDVMAAYLESTPVPSYRGLQVFLGRRPTPEITAAHRDEQVRQALEEMPAEDRAAIIREALVQPGVADKVAEDKEAMREIRAADNRRTEKVLRSAGVDEPRIESDTDRLTTSAWSVAYLGLDITKIASDLRRLARQLNELDGPIPVRYRKEMLEDVSDMKSSLDFIEAGIKRDTADWDAALSELGEEKR